MSRDLFAVAGAVTHNSFVVSAGANTSGTLTLEVATDEEFDDIIHTDSAASALNPSMSAGMPVKFLVSGLSTRTTYHWRVISSEAGSPTTTGKTTTFSPPGVAQSLVIVCGSCAGSSPTYPGATGGTSNAPTFARMLERNPDIMLHLGDLHYENITSAGDGWRHIRAIRRVLANENQHNLYRHVPTAYVWDDHDYGANNSNKSNPSRADALLGYRAAWPHYPLSVYGPAEDTPIMQDFWVGRVRVVMLDVRSERDPGNEVMLGSAQLAKLIQIIEEMGATPGILLLCAVVPWIASSGTDTWYGFSAERATIAQAIEDAGLTNRTIILCGDMHGLAIDDGRNNTYADGWTGVDAKGPPVFQAAPFDCTNSTKGGPYSVGTYSSSKNQYGVIEITDTGGSTIDYTLRGISLDGSGDESQVLTLSGTLSAEPQPAEIDDLQITANTPSVNALASAGAVHFITVPAGEYISPQDVAQLALYGEV